MDLSNILKQMTLKNEIKNFPISSMLFFRRCFGIAINIHPAMFRSIPKHSVKGGLESKSDFFGKERSEREFRCKHCNSKITLDSEQIQVAGGFQHTFLNPAGNIFHIGCFQKANGCVVIGIPSTEWSWFESYSWQIALCGDCLNHLGWFFNSGNQSSFFGLIIDTLV